MMILLVPHRTEVLTGCNALTQTPHYTGVVGTHSAPIYRDVCLLVAQHCSVLHKMVLRTTHLSLSKHVMLLTTYLHGCLQSLEDGRLLTVLQYSIS